MCDHLVGRWEAETDGGRRIAIDFAMVSNESALLETWRTAKGDSITVYHRDGAELLVTHYCGQGNQAHLRAVEATPERIRFRRVATTNHLPDQAGVLDDLIVQMTPNGVELTEIYVAPDGTRDTTVLKLARTATPASR